MVDFYREKNFTFKLKDLGVIEDFKIWIGFKQQITEQEMIAQYGVVLQFPIKTGQLPGRDGVPRDVQTQIKYMKKQEFEAQYPKLGRRTQFIRNILISGVEYRYAFSKTSNDKLNTMLALSPGVIPNVDFKQTFDGTKPAAQMYDIIVAAAEGVGAVGSPQVQQPTPQPPVTSTTQQPAPTTTPTPPPLVSNMMSLTNGEKSVMTAIKGLAKKLDKETFIKVVVQNLTKDEFGGLSQGVAAQRALIMFENHYN